MKIVESITTSTSWNSCQAVLQRWIGEVGTWDEDGLVPPSKQTIQFAMKLIGRLRGMEFECPTRVVPDGEGGLVFERRNSTSFKAIRVRSDDIIEFYNFQDSQLIDSFIVDTEL